MAKRKQQNLLDVPVGQDDRLPFEMVVYGRVVSFQNKTNLYREWKAKVREEAIRQWRSTPIKQDGLKFTAIFFYFDPYGLPDSDNFKRIQDALNGVVWEDDSQLVSSNSLRFPLQGQFHVEDLTWVIAEGFLKKTEFLYLRVEAAEVGRLK